jgi:anthranilate synthase component 2
MKILLVDNYDSFTYNLLQIVEEQGCCSCTVVKNDKIELNKVSSFNKILISPGPGLPAKAGKVCELIKTFASTKSILGICLGHQAIAKVYGGKLIRLSQVQHGIRKKISITGNQDYIFKGLPNKIDVGLYHSWAVSAKTFPDCLTVTAVSNDGLIMALSHKAFDVKGIQFHPESIMTEWGKQILYNWIEGCQAK